MSASLVHRVVARYLQARGTERYQHMEQLFKAVEDPLRVVFQQSYGWNRKETDPAKLNAVAADLSVASKALRDMLHYSGEGKKVNKILLDFKTKLNNLGKMLDAYASAHTWEQLKPVIDGQNTKAKDAFQKFRDYKGLALGLLKELDTEHEGTLHVARWNVALMTATDSDWTGDNLGRLEWVLKESAHILSRIGMSQVSGGTLLAWPTDILPPSALRGHSTLASYNPSSDSMAIAVEVNGNENRILGTLLHELGHRAYFKLVESQGHSAWHEFFDSNSGTPDVDSIIRDWEAYASSADYWANKYGRTLAYYASHLKKNGSKEQYMWLLIVTHAIGIKEKIKPDTGALAKGEVPALDQLIAKKGEVKVFLHPITAYSTTSAEEAFAEAFSRYATHGAGGLPEIVREAFRRTLPNFKGAALV